MKKILAILLLASPMLLSASTTNISKQKKLGGDCTRTGNGSSQYIVDECDGSQTTYEVTATCTETAADCNTAQNNANLCAKAKARDKSARLRLFLIENTEPCPPNNP